MPLGTRVALTTAEAAVKTKPRPFDVEEWGALNAAVRAYRQRRFVDDLVYAGADHEEWMLFDMPASCYRNGNQEASRHGA